MMFLCAPLLGALSDRFGRKPVLLAALAATSLSGFWTGFAGSLWALFAARAVGGLGGASVTVAQTYIADVTRPEDRAKNFGMVGAAFGVGFIVGPAIGGLLGAYGAHVPFVVAGAVALVNLLYGAFMVPESHKPEHRRAFTWVEANPLGWIVTMKRHREVRGFSMALVWVWMGQQALFSTWVLYTTYRFGWGTTDNGLSLAAVGVTSIIV
jgi:DHA1 family tetracycline resistance protein-like MFS transporter